MMVQLIKKIQWRYFWQYLLSLVLLGLLDLIIFDFDYHRLLTADFWLNLAINLTAMIVMFNTSTNQHVEKLVAQDDWIAEAEDALQTFSVEKGLDFEGYVAEVNFERKKEAYIAKLTAQIQALKVIPRFNPLKPFARRRRRKDLEIWGLKNEELKKKNYYCIQRKELEDRLLQIKNASREEAEEILMSVNIEYDQLTESAILVNKTYVTKKEFESSVQKKFRDNAANFVYIALFSIFMAGFNRDSLGITQITPAIAFNYLAKTWMLIRQYLNGQNYAPKFVKEHIKDQLQKRLDHVKGYWAWRENKRSEVIAHEANYLPREHKNRLYNVS